MAAIIALQRTLAWLNTVGCSHEWIRRRQGARLYLECRHCLHTTPGIEAAVWTHRDEGNMVAT